MIERYLSARVLKLGTIGNVSLPEIGRVMPVLSGYNLHPVVNVKMNGPVDRLGMTLDVKSEAGNVRGEVMTDLKTPDLAVRGEVDLVRLNIAPIVKEPARKTDLTGHAKVDIKIPSQPAGVRILDRMRGTFAFNGPHAAAEGYAARNVQVSGSLDGPRITLDSASGAAYGGTFTARGFIVPPGPRRDVSFDLQGKANSLDLRRLPPPLQVPLETTLSVADYHVRGEGPIISGTATLNESVVEGATLDAGTAGEFRLAPGEVSYGGARHGRQPRPRSNRRRVRDRRHRQARVRQPVQRDVRRHRQRAAWRRTAWRRTAWRRTARRRTAWRRTACGHVRGGCAAGDFDDDPRCVRHAHRLGVPGRAAAGAAVRCAPEGGHADGTCRRTVRGVQPGPAPGTQGARRHGHRHGERELRDPQHQRADHA